MTTTPLPRPTHALTAAAAVAALLSGCAATPPDQDPPETDASPPAQSAPPSPTPTPTAPAMPEAADGTDLDACADADCEALVEEGDEFAMDGTYGVDRFVVDTVGEDGLSISGYAPGIMVSGHLPPPDEEEPATFVMNGFTITLVALDGSSAIMRLSP